MLGYTDTHRSLILQLSRAASQQYWNTLVNNTLYYLSNQTKRVYDVQVEKIMEDKVAGLEQDTTYRVQEYGRKEKGPVLAVLCGKSRKKLSTPDVSG